MASMRHSRCFIWSGSLLIAAALCLTVWGLLDEQRAARSAQQALENLNAAEMQAAPPDSVSVPYEPGSSVKPQLPTQEMPVITVDGIDYLGTLEIPVLELSLPIISQWSDSLSKLAPCRYRGSVYLNDMILAGHNYRAHFSRLKDLQIGDAVVFTDAEGSCFHYTVSELEELPGTAVREMESGDWDLTLFTCTAGGGSRFVVRCLQNVVS